MTTDVKLISSHVHKININNDYLIISKLDIYEGKYKITRGSSCILNQLEYKQISELINLVGKLATCRQPDNVCLPWA